MRFARIRLVIYSDPMMFPPVVNAANIFAEAGADVEIWAKNYPTGDSQQLGRGVRLKYFGPLRSGLVLRLDYTRFVALCVSKAKRQLPHLVIGYDMLSALAAWCSSRVSGADLVYWNQDLTQVSNLGLFYRCARRFEYWAARRASAVVFPQCRRAEVFARAGRLKRKPVIVHNGPRLRWADGKSVDEGTRTFRKAVGQVVLYQGGLNWRRGLKVVLESMPLWERPAGLLLVGSVKLEPTFASEAMDLAAELGVANRVMIRGQVAYEDLPSIGRGCDVGVAVMSDPTVNKSINIRNLAGASNKIAEYMACGLPIVAPLRRDYLDFLGDSGEHGLLVDPRRKEDVARGVSALLRSETLRREIGARNRNRFVKELNFDVQLGRLVQSLSLEELAEWRLGMHT